MEPEMSFVERLMLLHYLRKATRYAEYGSGGSTTIANIFRSIVSIVSIESDPEYATRVHKLAPRARICHIDVGPIGDHGHPVDESKKDNWPSYSAQDLGNPDLVLVDGRWRVACICHVLRTYPTASLLVHDFMNRPEYHPVLTFCDIVKQVDTLVSLKRKEGVSDQAIADLYEAYKYEQA
jgi:protein O-GlcNAc transferase